MTRIVDRITAFLCLSPLPLASASRVELRVSRPSTTENDGLPDQVANQLANLKV